MNILNDNVLSIFMEKVAFAAIGAPGTNIPRHSRLGDLAKDRLAWERARDMKRVSSQMESNPFSVEGQATRPGNISYRNPSAMRGYKFKSTVGKAVRTLGRFGGGFGKAVAGTAALVGLAGVAGSAAASSGSPYEVNQ